MPLTKQGNFTESVEMHFMPKMHRILGCICYVSVVLLFFGVFLVFFFKADGILTTQFCLDFNDKWY